MITHHSKKHADTPYEYRIAMDKVEWIALQEIMNFTNRIVRDTDYHEDDELLMMSLILRAMAIQITSIPPDEV